VSGGEKGGREPGKVNMEMGNGTGVRGGGYRPCHFGVVGRRKWGQLDEEGE